MIKFKKGRMQVNGELGELSADYICITKGYIEFLEKEVGMPREEAIERVKEEFQMGLMTEEEVMNKIKKEVAELLVSV